MYYFCMNLQSMLKLDETRSSISFNWSQIRYSMIDIMLDFHKSTWISSIELTDFLSKDDAENPFS